MGGTRDLRRRVCLVVAMLLVAGLSSLPALAGPEDELESNQQRLQRIEEQIEQANEKQDSLTAQITELDEERAEVETKVLSLDGQLAALNDEIGQLTARLENTQSRLAIVTKELTGLEKDLEASEEIHVARAIDVYKAGPTADIEALVSAESFGDLVDRYEYYAAALDQDAQLIAKIDGLRVATFDKQQQIEEAKAEIVKARLQLEKDRQELDAARAEKAAVLAQQEAVIDTKDGLLAVAEEEEEKLSVARDRIEEDSSRIQALLEAREQAAAGETTGGPIPSGPAPTGGGQLAWPAVGPVTSPYGYRIHPIFGYSRLHSGVDIGAGYGARVIAADDGVVAFVGVMSGYGNVVVVDHGGGMATTYNHLSTFSVSSGQTVQRGQTVAAVGSTGYSTGPHLHFEVRINGTPTDPMPYLS